MIKRKDHTNLIIFGLFSFFIAMFVFGVAFEVLKFVALIKWVLS